MPNDPIAGLIPTVSTTPKKLTPNGKIIGRPPKPPWALKFQSLAEIEAETTEFLWNPYIPRGAITLLFGYGGLGKSWITCSLAADISAGRALPGHNRPYKPQKVLMISAEDDPARIIRPRMEILRANLDNIVVSEEAFVLNKEGVDAIEEAMKQVAATVVFLDPLVSYLGEKVDMNKSNETRAQMGPLGEAAKRTGCAVVVVHHSRKQGGGRDANRAMGSADFINSVRSAIMVDEGKDGGRYMSHVKHNWSSKGPTLSYGMDGDSFHWGGELTEDLGYKVSTVPLALGRAKDYLFDTLKNGPLPVLEVEHGAEALGIQARTLQRAKKGLVYSTRTKDGWNWALLDHAKLVYVPSNSGNATGNTVAPVENIGGGAAQLAQDALLATLGRGTAPSPAPSSDPVRDVALVSEPGVDPALLKEALARLGRVS